MTIFGVHFMEISPVFTNMNTMLKSQCNIGVSFNGDVPCF